MSDFFSGFGIGDILSLGLSAFQDSKDRSAAKNAAYMGSLTGTVNQARRLGISPIAALGYSGYQPTLIAGQPNLGSGLKDLIDRLQRREGEKKKARAEAGSPDGRIRRAQAREAEANADLAEIQLLEARGALRSGPGNPTPPPMPAEGCSPDQPLYVKRYDPIAKKTVWHPNIRCWPELGEAAGALATGKAKGATTTPYNPAAGTRRSRRQRGKARSKRGQ